MIPVFAKFYDTPDGVKSFGQLFRMAVKNVVSYDYNAKWTSGGEFSLVLPTDKIYVSTLNTGMIVEIDGDWLFVESVNYDKIRTRVREMVESGISFLKVINFSRISLSNGYI